MEIHRLQVDMNRGALFNPVQSPVPAVGKGKLTPQEHVSEAKWEGAVLPYALLSAATLVAGPGIPEGTFILRQ